MNASTRILVGHVLDRLRDLPDESVHMIWTSPPYWGLRAYGTVPQVWGGDSEREHDWGEEKRLRKTGGTRASGLGKYSNGLTAEHIVTKMERGKSFEASTGAYCHRCGAWRGEHGLEPSLDLWLQHEVLIFREARRVLRSDGTLWLNIGDAYSSGGRSYRSPDKKHDGRGMDVRPDTPQGLKPKDRLMLPARLAIALQADGWWLRDEIVWHKLNPMPSSVTDRTTPAHEMLYLFSKSPRYYYDGAAIREQASANTHPRRAGNGYKTPDGWDTSKGAGGHGSIHRSGREKGRKLVAPGSGTKNNSSMDAALAVMPEDRNKRSVWSIASEPFSGAHFATAPTALVLPCVMAGCPKGGTVLDPFGGSGTTALVANRLGRNAILIELNPEYVAIAHERLGAGLCRFASDLPEPENPLAGLPLFDPGALDAAE